MAELINVGDALEELHDLIATIDQKVAAFSAQSQEAEASLAEAQKKLIKEAREELTAIAEQAGADAAARAIGEVETARADFDKRVAEIEAKLIAVETALSPKSTRATPAEGVADGGDEISRPIRVPATPAAAAGAASPRMAELIETVASQQREIASLRKGAIWTQRFLIQLCAADGVSYQVIKAKVDAEEGAHAESA